MEQTTTTSPVEWVLIFFFDIPIRFKVHWWSKMLFFVIDGCRKQIFIAQYTLWWSQYSVDRFYSQFRFVIFLFISICPKYKHAVSLFRFIARSICWCFASASAGFMMKIDDLYWQHTCIYIAWKNFVVRFVFWCWFMVTFFWSQCQPS